jgi:hypothetical protein
VDFTDTHLEDTYQKLKTNADLQEYSSQGEVACDLPSRVIVTISKSLGCKYIFGCGRIQNEFVGHLPAESHHRPEPGTMFPHDKDTAAVT